MNLKQALVFSILMQGNGGILSKAPSYIMERLRICDGLDNCEVLLDHINLSAYRGYKIRWGIEDWT